MTTTLARTFAALSAINEAILYAKSPDELYQKVCDAGFSSGDFLAVAVFLVEPDGRRLRFAAAENMSDRMFFITNSYFNQLLRQASDKDISPSWIPAKVLDLIVDRTINDF